MSERVTLNRELGLFGLVATGVCAMLGAGINVVPFMIQRHVPGIGPSVLAAYAIAVVPALLSAFCYAALSSAMPRAGGSYVFASRSLHPYLGFVASFSQWFGLSMAIGVVSYVLVPFLRDIAIVVDWQSVVSFLEFDSARLFVPLVFLWSFTIVNLLGGKFYQRTLIPLMVLMLAGGLIVIPAGFAFDHSDFLAAAESRQEVLSSPSNQAPFSWLTVMTASVFLFSSFIGFDSVAQAGGEAKNPTRNLPLAICISILGVAAYYMAFTAAVYHAVPWHYIAERATNTDLTAPGLLGYLLSPEWTIVIVVAATIALANDLPAMILSTSRLVFAWAEDGFFPSFFSGVGERFRTPHSAIVLSSLVSTFGIFGNYVSGDFFLGIDLLVTAMLVNFFLMAISILALPIRNPDLAKKIRFMRSRLLQTLVGVAAGLMLFFLIVIQVIKDVTTEQESWYFHALYTYLVVLVIGSLIFLRGYRQLVTAGVDLKKRFLQLPSQ